MPYTKIVDFAAKDALSTGNAAKLIKGTEIGAEFDAIQTADALNVKTTALGTGVATAAGVNIGSAGALVVNGGALGTPTSGVATNLTGTAAALNIGGNAATATTATSQSGGTVAATTISASGLISATGGQVAFPATQNASSNANTLDDYEEGTWTVTATNLTVVGTPTYYGRYTKIGRMVHINVTLSATTSTASTATATYVDLPFAAENSVSNRWVCSVCGYDLTSYGNGLLRNTSALYLPTWAATATNIQISCSYMAVD